MANKHRVEFDGLIFKRTSKERAYTHLVIAPVSLHAALEQARESARWSWRNNWNFHASMVDGSYEGFKRYPEHYPAEERAKLAAEGKAWIELGEQGHIDQARAKALKYWRESFPDRDTAWRVRGWCGRLDLAMKQAKLGDKILEVTK